MDGTSLAGMLGRIDRLRCGEAVALFAPLADALEPGDAGQVGELAALAARALLGVPPEGALPAAWPELLAAHGVPVGLVAVLAAAVAEQVPTARELATALRATCDPLPLNRLQASA